MEKTLVILIVITILVGTIFFLFFRVEYIESIQINQDVIDIINSKFEENYNQKTEFLLCLKGKIKDGVGYIDDAIESNVITFNEEGIEAGCPFSTFGTIHNHNNFVCKLSSQDLYTFGISRDSMMGIICGGDKIVFYTPNSLKQSVDVKIT